MRPDHEIAIIGAGIGGLGTAIALREAGFDDLVILERASDIGGTWRDNTYPGVGVDIPAQAYQFSYELKPDWSRIFAKGAEVKAYVDQVAAHHDLWPLIRLDHEVLARTWDEDAGIWRLAVPGGELTARYVISAIGAFVDPKPTAIEGVETFEGPVLRSASWDHDVDLRDRRVAIVGTGASAVQIVPELADEVARLDVYQRTPIWVAPKPDLPTPRALEALFRRVPRVQQLVRRATTRGTEVILIDLVTDHDRYGWMERGMRRALRDLWYPLQVRDRELRRRLTPDYDFGCKRPAVSNRYLRTFTRDHVELVTDPIARITPRGVAVTRPDGTVQEREVDVLVLATGFRLATDPENYRRTPVRGRDGFDLATFYAQERATSYESVSIPGLPNHFMIFGPYGWTGGTWHQLVETASAHVVRVLQEARRRDRDVVAVRPEAAQRWTRFAVERMGRSLWQQGTCAPARSYYFDHHGDTPFLRPTTAAEAARAAASFPLEDYVYEHSPAAARSAATPMAPSAAG